MNRSLFLLIALFSALAISFAGCGGGGGGDDDDDATPADDTGGDDDVDDTGDDDADDDTIPDDDTNPDDTDDDSTPPDTEYPSTLCTLPDPATLGDGKLIGGGAPTDTINVYVYDDATCAAIENATVVYGAATFATDADGHAVVTPLTDAAYLVTAFEADHTAWSYKAEASTMYFRLRPDTYPGTYGDSAAGDFTDGGTALDLPASNIGNLFTSPIYLGVALPGLSLESVFSLDFDHLFAEGTFDLTLNTGTPEVTPLPDSIYLPGLNLSVLTYGVSGANPQYAVPVNSTASVSPLEGIVAGVDVTSAIPNITDLIGIILCVTAPSADILACVSDHRSPHQ